MKSHSLVKRKQLTAQILILQNKIQTPDEPKTADTDTAALRNLTNEIAPITKLHTDIQNSSESLFNDLRSKIRQLLENEYDQTNKDSLKALNKSLAAIATADILPLVPANTQVKTQWQYRYALALGLLDDYNLFLQESLPSLRVSFLSKVAPHMNAISPEDVVGLLSSPPENKDIFKEAIEKKIVTRHYLAHKDAILETKRKQAEAAENLTKAKAIREKELKELAEKEAPAKAAYEEELKQFETELLLLRSNAACQSSGLITETCKYSNQFIEALKKDINVTISYQNATEVLTETRGMIKELKAAVAPGVDKSTRSQHQNEANKHANKILALADKRKDQQSNAWKWALLISGIVLLTFGILALTAVTHGAFLGVGLTAIAVKTVAGVTTTATVLNSAGTGLLLGGLFSTMLGGAATLGGIGSIAIKNNSIKDAAQNMVNSTKKALVEEKQQEVQSVGLNKM